MDSSFKLLLRSLLQLSPEGLAILQPERVSSVCRVPGSFAFLGEGTRKKVVFANLMVAKCTLPGIRLRAHGGEVRVGFSWLQPT